MIFFVQPFGLGSAGGGARILRALLNDAPVPTMLVCTSPEPPPIVDQARGTHLPLRPYFGKIERTRLAFLPNLVTPLFHQRFCRRFEQLCRESGATAIHAIPHSEMDFHHVHRIAGQLKLPFFLQMHDDFAFSSRTRVDPARAHGAMQFAWRDAHTRFVICPQLGQEYCRRYGEREYIVITDGLENVAPVPAVRATNQLRVYFMGLFHLEYEENLRALCAALEQVRKLRPSMKLSVTLRCGTLRPEVSRAVGDLVQVLPFGREVDVQNDLDRADLLFLPLPFARRFDSLVRFSLSTKMVTYLGSGRPILYHGPKSSAVYEMLAEDSAALFQTSLDVDPLAQLLCRICDGPQTTDAISARALQLARSRFMLQDQRDKFWNALMPSTVPSFQVSNAR